MRTRGVPLEGNSRLNETELYRELGALTKNRDEWERNIPYVSSLLSSDSVKIRAKALWLLGEMGLKHPASIRGSVPAVASFCDSGELLLGDIVLSTEHVLQNAAEFGHSVEREYAFLIVHSMLHLTGFDHIEESDRIRMEEAQKAIMQIIGISR